MASCSFQIDNRCHQFPSSLIIFMLASILFFANPKYLAVPVEVFNQDTLLCQLLIELFLLFGQRFVLGLLWAALGLF